MKHAGHPPAVAHSLHHKKTGRSSHSYHHQHQHQHHHSRASIIHPDLLGAPRIPSKLKAEQREDKPDMAASFLQFCAMCEKQIAVPSNAVLYCSESCRRKDSCKPLSASLPGSTLNSAAPSPPTSTPSSPRVILPPLTPTAAPLSASLGRIPTDAHSYKSDLDPTEWKPKIHRPRGVGHGHVAAQSEAARYLSQFHTPSPAAAATASTMNMNEAGYFGFAAATASSDQDDNASTLRRRSYMSRASVTSLSTVSVPGTPGLSSSPTTVSSSYSSMPGVSSSSSGHYSGYDSSFITTFDPVPHRPLPPRQKSFYAGGSFGSGLGLDLVTPHYVMPASGGAPAVMQPKAGVEGVDCSGIFWEKRIVNAGKEKRSGASEGLGRLLRGAE